MENFNQLIEKAQATGDRRKKAFTDLKSAAPSLIIAYANAMKAMGYKDTDFKIKLFLNQVEFACDSMEGSESWLKLDFESQKFIEATGETVTRKGELENIFDGEEYPLKFSTNTSGVALIQLLEKLPQRLENCIVAIERQIDEVSKVIRT